MDLTTCAKAVEPLLLPIHNNPISTDGAGNVRGIPVTLGDPNQFFSMRPAVVQNTTMLATTAQCEVGNYSCIAIYGGLYEPSSSAFQTNSLGSWNGTQGFEFDNTQGITFFNDRMGIEGKIIPGFPFVSRVSTDDDATFDQAILALGTNSSFLQSAIDLNYIPSKQWSYWAGDASNDIAGHVILGGYDQNRISGEMKSFTSLLPLGLVFEINSIVWTESSGNTTDLMEGTSYTILGANIETGQEYIELPETIRTNFYDATGADYDYSTGPASYASRPSGTLDITTTNGYKVSIASQDLFDHGRTYDSNGDPEYDVYQDWVPRVFQIDTYSKSKLTFGAPFLAGQYLITDIEHEQFYLAEAVQGTGSSTDIKPLCTGGAAPTSTPKSSGGKTNVAAIAGGVGGGVAVLIIVGIILFFVLRHRRRAHKTPASAVDSPAPPGNGYQPVSQASQYPSPVPAASPVFTEKHMMHQDDQKLSIPVAQVNHVEELPSPGSDTFSRSSQTYTTVSHSQNNQGPQYYAEMPAQHYP